MKLFRIWFTVLFTFLPTTLLASLNEVETPLLKGCLQQSISSLRFTVVTDAAEAALQQRYQPRSVTREEIRHRIDVVRDVLLPLPKVHPYTLEQRSYILHDLFPVYFVVTWKGSFIVTVFVREYTADEYVADAASTTGTPAHVFLSEEVVLTPYQVARLVSAQLC